MKRENNLDILLDEYMRLNSTMFRWNSISTTNDEEEKKSLNSTMFRWNEEKRKIKEKI